MNLAPKPALKSTTIQGSLITLLGYLINQFKLDQYITQDDVGAIVANVLHAIDVIMVIGGLLMTIYGRWQARRPIEGVVTPGSDTVRHLLAFGLSGTILFGSLGSVACGASEVQKVVGKTNSVMQAVNSQDSAALLLAEKLITEAEAKFLREKINAFITPFGEFSADLAALVKANPNANLADVAPAFAEALLRFNEIGLIRFEDPRAQLRFEQIMGGARLALTFISAFFAASLDKAARLLKSTAPLALARVKLKFAGVPYDAKRFKQAQALARSGTEDAGAKAVCAYFSISYDREQVALVRAFAKEHAGD